MTQIATTGNPVLDSLTTEEIAKLAEARGLHVKAPKVKAEKIEKAEKTDEEMFLEAVAHIATVEDGKIVVIHADSRKEGTAATVFEALSMKSRTTLEKIAKASKPAYTGAKRGPKAKSEQAPEAAQV